MSKLFFKNQREKIFLKYNFLCSENSNVLLLYTDLEIVFLG